MGLGFRTSGFRGRGLDENGRKVGLGCRVGLGLRGLRVQGLGVWGSRACGCLLVLGIKALG